MLNYVVLGALFFALLPGILVTLPRGGDKYTVGLAHAVLFVAAFVGVQYIAGDFNNTNEGFAFFANSYNRRFRSYRN